MNLYAADEMKLRKAYGKLPKKDRPQPKGNPRAKNRELFDKVEEGDCKINAEGYCDTHQKTHVRGRAHDMGIPLK
jgi:hypothetical protein